MKVRIKIESNDQKGEYFIVDTHDRIYKRGTRSECKQAILQMFASGRYEEMSLEEAVEVAQRHHVWWDGQRGGGEVAFVDPALPYRQIRQ